MSDNTAVEHIFRHEYGQLVASLLRRTGPQCLELVEDAVQFAMLQAVDTWPGRGKPDNPGAWLYRVAYRHLMSEFRSNARHQEILTTAMIAPDAYQDQDVPLQGEMQDAMLNMMFVVCQQSLPVESQLVFTLKSICGFSTSEIALRLFVTQANVYKRFSRARDFLRLQSLDPSALNEQTLNERLPQVHKVIYLLFTEGHLSSHTDLAIRRDLCDEAIRLARLLCESRYGACPPGFALVALMYFHLARMDSRQDQDGELLLLADQDRSQWNKPQIAMGLQFLQLAGQGEHLTRYHLEASIAAEHCLATSLESTRWRNIAKAYALLEHVSPSPMYRLNRALAIAECEGPHAGLKLIEEMDVPGWLARSYHWHAAKADLLYRNKQHERAEQSALAAIDSAPSAHIQALLNRRFSIYT